MATKVNHHYIPQFYLRQFASGLGRQAKVFAFDSKDKTSFLTLVRNVGSKRNFFRIEVQGLDPNALEDGMAEIEASISIHLADVIGARTFPTPDHFNSIMNLLAFLSVRIPRFRDKMDDFHKQVVERMMNIALSKEEIWTAQMKSMKREGHTTKENVTYEEMKRFHEEKQYTVEIDQTHLIATELKLLDPVLNTAANRNWCFVSAPENAQFICSDDPVVLSWKDAEGMGPYPPGHGLSGTRVLFPLSSKLLLVGEFEDLPVSYLASEEFVVQANSQIARYSTRQIYARDSCFEIYAHGERVRGQDLAKHFEQRERSAL